MPELTRLQQFICSLYDRHIILFDLKEGFELASHRDDPSKLRSPIYYNFRLRDHPTRPGAMTRGDLRTMAEFMCDVALKEGLSFGGLAPVPDAGVAFAEEIRQELYHRPGNRNVPVVLSEKATGRIVSRSDLVTGNTLLQIDDVTSDGRSKIRFILGARDGGYQVRACLVFALRNKKALSLLDKYGVRLCCVTTAEETIQTLKLGQCISGRDCDEGLRQMELLETA